MLAQQIKSDAARIGGNLNQISGEIDSTESIFVSQSATEMRDKFKSMKEHMDRFQSYLEKVATYLVQNVAETAEAVESVASANVASIRKPQ